MYEGVYPDCQRRCGGMGVNTKGPCIVVQRGLVDAHRSDHKRSEQNLKALD